MMSRFDVGAPAKAEHGACLAHAVYAAHHVQHEIVEFGQIAHQANETEICPLAQPIDPEWRHTG